MGFTNDQALWYADVTFHTLTRHPLSGQGQRMRLAKHPATRQGRTSNGPDAVTFYTTAAFWLRCEK